MSDIILYYRKAVVHVVLDVVDHMTSERELRLQGHLLIVSVVDSRQDAHNALSVPFVSFLFCPNQQQLDQDAEQLAFHRQNATH